MTDTTTRTPAPGAAIAAEVASWPGVTAGYGRRGEYAFRVGRREIGHLHGDRVAHMAFPKDVWRTLRDAGRITEHPVFPGRPGWAQRTIRGPEDVADVIALLRMNYARATARDVPDPEPWD